MKKFLAVLVLTFGAAVTPVSAQSVSANTLTYHSSAPGLSYGNFAGTFYVDAATPSSYPNLTILGTYSGAHAVDGVWLAGLRVEVRAKYSDGWQGSTFATLNGSGGWYTTDYKPLSDDGEVPVELEVIFQQQKIVAGQQTWVTIDTDIAAIVYVP